ncbi:MAG: hydroxymyristoyl-ACP dehydratase [Bacteroidetes bacterium]|nr:MAG: hydroxymyristoyl-ACP dehydratase [Bacteroidota bacterium]
MTSTEKIISYLPYTPPFLFVDSLEAVTENGARGHYTFPADSFFYQGHFKDYPVTPGVILTETMAQIGVVCLGIFLLGDKLAGADVKIALTSQAVDFYVPVYPGETVTVVSDKLYFRFGKLKCQVEMRNQKNELVCQGTIAGMMKR